ncbi:MAG: GNAT family N-acetyltransferase [Planctomycetota bacterium]
MTKPPHQFTAEDWDRAGLPQLRMRLPEHAKPAPAPLFDGYALRGFCDGDEQAWIDILNRCDFGVWDRQRLDDMLAGARAPLPTESIVFATQDDTPVGVANGFLYPDPQGQRCELGWVGVLPEHRGRRLAMAICREVVRYAQDAGHIEVFLLTEDFRLGAIQTYLRLGFREVLPADDAVAARWLTVRDVLGWPA